MAGYTYGNVYSRKNNVYYNGIGISAWDLGQAERAMKDMEAVRGDFSGKHVDRWNQDYTTVRSRYMTLEAAARAEELQEAMAASYASMAAAANRVEPAREPLKQAQEVLQGSRDQSLRLQQLRTGLASAFNRYGQSSAFKRPTMTGKKEGLGI